EAVEGLRRRSLIERSSAGASFTLQSVVLEYVTDRLVDQIADEIHAGEPDLLVRQPLVQATAKEYVRQSQERLVGRPLLDRLGRGPGGAGAIELGWQPSSSAGGVQTPVTKGMDRARS